MEIADKNLFEHASEIYDKLTSSQEPVQVICHMDCWPEFRGLLDDYVHRHRGLENINALADSPIQVWTEQEAILKRDEYVKSGISVMEITKDKIYSFGDAVLDMVD